MKIDEGVNGKIHSKVRQMLNSKAYQKTLEKSLSIGIQILEFLWACLQVKVYFLKASSL